MNELIQIDSKLIGTEKIQTVNARDLWKYLESKQEFANWIKNRINESQATENQDFISFNNIIKRETGATVKKEYHITLDLAKHFAMLERNDKGKQIRQYFIDVEKKAREVIPKNDDEFIALAVIKAQKKIDLLQQTVEEQKIEIQDKTETIYWLQCQKNLRVLETRIQESPRKVMEHFCLDDYKEAYRLIYREFKKFRGYDIGKLWKKKRRNNKETLTKFLIRTGRQTEYLQVIKALLSVKNIKELQINKQLEIWD